MNELIKYYIRINITDEKLKLEKANEHDSGYDLKANIESNTILKPGEIKAIETGIKIELPINLEAQIRPRSGLAIKKGITVLNSPGTIDSGYIGEIIVILINHGKEPVTINKYDKIAQIIFQEKTNILIEYTSKIFNTTKRGIKGFGSSDQ